MQKKCTAYSRHACDTIPVKSVQQVLLAEQVKSCVISCINSPGSTVVSGTVEESQDIAGASAGRWCQDDSTGSSIRLPLSTNGSHLGGFRSDCAKIRFAKPVVPVASTHKANSSGMKASLG
jgi:hypothetical protein